MNGASSSPKVLHVHDIFTDSLLEYAQNVVFPWDLDKPLRGAKVGIGLFQHARPNEDWDTPEVRTALMKLAEIGFDKINENLDEFPEFVREASVDDGDLSAPDRNLGMILTLDQGARYVCRGVNARYAYDFFQRIPIHTLRYIASNGTATLEQWEFAGVDKDQAMIRLMIMLGAFVHSEDPADHEQHLRHVEVLRKDYERLSRTKDPFRQSFSEDIQDIELYGRMLEEGPPQWRGVHMSDVLYWMMRLFRSHIAFLRHFGRSPLRNVAVGRDDTDEETAWLKTIGVERTQEDEETRAMVKEDIAHGQWRPLEL